MSKKLVTEREVADFLKSGSKVFIVGPDTILTPSAKDALFQHRIQIVFGEPGVAGQTTSFGSITISNPDKVDPGRKPVVVAIGSDHGGFRLKESLIPFLTSMDFAVANVGTNSEEACDYPDFAFAVAKMVQSGQAAFGIMIDGVGVASAIVANKVPGIRAVPCYDEFVARSSKEHNNANVLTLGGRVVGAELAKSIVKIWLNTPFAAGRHEGRVNKIGDIERRYSKGS